MKKQEEENTYVSNDEALHRLNHCHSRMERAQLIPRQLFQEYISIYVQKQSLSEDFFICLCEHGVIQRLFGASAKQLSSTDILEMFNLLLANTSQLSILVYLFSQPSLHQYLFQKFNIFRQSAESVQYYIQLLKTIIMKISIHHNNSLIKLFCNNRYPSFPLLTVITLLSTASHQQNLVKITAQQCILLLIALINQKQVGRGYLNDLQMVVFYFELVNDLIDKQKADQEGLLKYLVDLIYTLRNNLISLSFLLNTLTNALIVRHVHNFTKIITFFTHLTQLIRQYDLFPESLAQQIMNIFSRIVNKVYFDHFINSTYLTALKIIPKLQPIPQPNLLSFFQQRGKNIHAHLLQYDKKPQYSQEKMLAFQGWKHFNDSSQQVINIKQNKQQQKSVFFGMFTIKSDPNEKYIKLAITMAGLNFDRLKSPLFKLSVRLNYQTAVYILEQALYKQSIKLSAFADVFSGSEPQIYEIHFNEYRGNFQFDRQTMHKLLMIVRELNSNKINWNQKEESIKVQIKGYQFQYYLMTQLRSYLTHSLNEHVLNSEYEPKILEMVEWSSLIAELQIRDNLERKCKQKLLYKIQKLQQQIHQLIFQNDFKYLIQYVLHDKYHKYIQINYLDQQQTLITSQSTLQIQIDTKIFQFQLLRTLVDSSLPSITQHMQHKWHQIIKQSYDNNKLRIQWKDKFNNSIQIYPNQNQEFKVKQHINQVAVRDFVLERIDYRVDGNGDAYILFLPENCQVPMKNKQEAVAAHNKISRLQSYRQQIITKAILEYFESVHSSLCQKIYRHKNAVVQK